jgi:hypothetical protein
MKRKSISPEFRISNDWSMSASSNVSFTKVSIPAFSKRGTKNLEPFSLSMIRAGF